LMWDPAKKCSHMNSSSASKYEMGMVYSLTTPGYSV
jgi:hypothetical protein